MPEKTFFGTFRGFFLGQIFFLADFYFFSGSLKFSRAHFRIFSRDDFFSFSGRNSRISRYFFKFDGENLKYFSRAKNFFFGLNFSRAVFKIFF